ncbi:GEM-like protein 4 [Linum perenne]
MKNPFQVTGIPVSSLSHTVKKSHSAAGYLTGSADTHNRCTTCTPASDSQAVKQDHSRQGMLTRINSFGKKADSFANRVKEHVRLGPKITETVKGKLSLGAKILQGGGVERIFRQLFNVDEDEKLLKASQCYLSTTAGPIAGLLFISTYKLAFCSDRSIKFSSPNGESIRVHYKVLIPLSKIKRVNESENAKRPCQKYVEVVTVDNFDFWFMGFLNYRKAFKHLELAITSEKHRCAQIKY